jgi:hypothetical protein
LRPIEAMSVWRGRGLPPRAGCGTRVIPPRPSLWLWNARHRVSDPHLHLHLGVALLHAREREVEAADRVGGGGLVVVRGRGRGVGGQLVAKHSEAVTRHDDAVVPVQRLEVELPLALRGEELQLHLGGGGGAEAGELVRR